MPKEMGILSIIHVCIWQIVCPKPCSCLYKSKFPSSLVSPLKLTSESGCLYRISNCKNPISAQGEHLTFKRATGNMSTQDKLVSWHSFARVSFVWGFSSCVSLSLSSRDSRQYAISTRFSKPLPTVSLPQVQMPAHCPTLCSEAFHIWRQCLSGALVYSLAFSAQVGKASTQPENMQIETKSYLNLWLGVISVMSSAISSKAESPQWCLPASLLGPWQALFHKQVTHHWETEDQSAGRWAVK